MLYGRVREQDHIAQVLDGARSGRGAALVVLGEPGTGKSALLAESVESVEDLTVLRVRGIESEAPLAFAALQRLLRPLRSYADRLPAPQTQALRGAFGEEEGGSSDRFLVFLATLSLLAEAAEDRPVVVVVDDAHWLDDASAAALLFVARRLEVERLSILFAARASDVQVFDPTDLPTLHLTGLDLAAAIELLRDRTETAVSQEVAAQLLASTGGNPLALVEVPQALSDEQLTGRALLPGRLPVTGTVERVFLDRARRLSSDAQRLLLVVAADDSMLVSTVLRASAVVQIGPESLNEAEQSGLVRVDGSTVELRHPLVRSAVYAAATSAERRGVHAALADAMTHPDDVERRAWHRAASVDQPDAGVVADLDAAAGRAERRGGHEAAAAAWERAAELSVDSPGRASRLYAAGQAAWLGGQTVRAGALADAARVTAVDPLLLSDIVRLRARVEFNTGSVQVSHRMLLEAARAVAAHDPDRALELAMVAAALAAFGGDSGVGIDPTDFATIPAGATGRRRCHAELTLGLRHVVAGDWPAATTMLRRALASGTELELEDQDLLTNLGIAALHLGDTETSAAYLGRLLTQARDSGAVVMVLYRLTRLAFSDVPMGRWATASARQHEALRLGESTGQPALAACPGPPCSCWLRSAARTTMTPGSRRSRMALRRSRRGSSRS